MHAYVCILKTVGNTTLTVTTTISVSMAPIFLQMAAPADGGGTPRPGPEELLSALRTCGFGAVVAHP